MVAAFTIRRCLQGWQALPVPGASSAWRVLLLAVVGTTAAFGQRNITDTGDATLVLVFPAGSLTPANSSTLTSGQVQFRLRCQDATGYHLNAVATFNAGAAATVDGGDTIAAKDIGIGITSILTTSQVDLPRADAILFGFNRDPATALVTDGLTPYQGAALGIATLADLIISKKILSGNRIDSTSNTGSPNYLLVTLSLGTLPQYFSTSNFSFMITLTIAAGP